MASKLLTFKRTVAVSAEQVFYAFTNALSLSEWLCDFAYVNLSAGNRLYCQWRDGRARMGRYVTLTPAKKVVLDWRGDEEEDVSQVTVTISEKEDSSTVTLTETSESKGWAKRAAEAEAFWNAALDNLVSTLESGFDLRTKRRPYLGLDVAVHQNSEPGAAVTGVEPESPAHAAGLQAGDVITALGSDRVSDQPTLEAALYKHSAGDKVKITYLRDGKKLAANVVLAAATETEVPESHEVLAEIVARKYTEVNRDLTQALKGVSDERAARAPAPGRWSARQVLAHLVESERHLHHWLTCLIAGEVVLPENPPSGRRERLDAVINGFPTVQALLTELKRNEAETVALLNALPPAFLARRASYRRMAEVMLTWPDHARQHLEEIKYAIRNVKVVETW
ncbi:MAG: PDZ domain-containing protein [Anaerolineae bacterium]|nr:PDZ domain-containing protein [Thermoflexales bacterium]MDW8395179.1 PDZ domain-containing protein [Anaerolineae bacterium]